MRKLILGAAAAAMITGSSIAQAAPVAREAAPASTSEELAGGSHLVLGLLAAGLLVFILFQINDQDGEDVDLPTSP